MAAKDSEETENISETHCLESDEFDSEHLKSDEVKDMYCEHCERFFSKNLSAVGFCVNCVEYMCDTCLAYHMIYMSSHTIQDKNSMPQDFYFEKCDVHKNELIKFYCNKCEKAACAECKVREHSDCSDVKHLSSLVKDMEESKELGELFESKETITQQVNDIENHIDTTSQQISEEVTMEVSTIQQDSEEAVAAFKKQQQEILDDFDTKMEETIARLKKKRNILVDHLEEKTEEFEKKINQFKLESIQSIHFCNYSDSKELESLQINNDLIKLKLNKLHSSIEQQKSLGERCKIFLNLKKAQADVQEVKVDVGALEKEATSFSSLQRHYSEHRLNFMRLLKLLKEELECSPHQETPQTQ